MEIGGMERERRRGMRRECWNTSQTIVGTKSTRQKGSKSSRKRRDLGRNVDGMDINEETDPNQFIFTSDGRICRKERNEGHNSQRSMSQRITRTGIQGRPASPIMWNTPSVRRSTIFHGISGRGAWDESELELSLAVELSLSAPHNYPCRSSSCPSVDETADPNLYCIGPDGTIRPKVALQQEAQSFEDESRRSGVSWIRTPTERSHQRMTTPPPRPRLRNRILEDSPSTVVVDDYYLGQSRNTSRMKSADDEVNWIDNMLSSLPPQVPSKLKSQTQSTPKIQYVAPSCILDKSRRAVIELLASLNRSANLPSTSTPTFNPNQMTYENLLLLDSGPLTAIERAKKGLTSKQLQTIHSILIYSPPSSQSLSSNSSTISLPQCSICQEEFNHNDHGVCLPSCQHVFHGECLGPWLVGHSLCPNCRQNIV